MSSETSMVAEDFRLKEWAAQIRECQSRPAGINGIWWSFLIGETVTVVLAIICLGIAEKKELI